MAIKALSCFAPIVWIEISHNIQSQKTLPHCSKYAITDPKILPSSLPSKTSKENLEFAEHILHSLHIRTHTWPQWSRVHRAHGSVQGAVWLCDIQILSVKVRAMKFMKKTQWQGWVVPCSRKHTGGTKKTTRKATRTFQENRTQVKGVQGREESVCAFVCVRVRMRQCTGNWVQLVVFPPRLRH